MAELLEDEFIQQFGELKWHVLENLMNELEGFLNYSFKDRTYFIRSLLLLGDLPDRIYFQTYEFLGDSVLNLIISEYLTDVAKLLSPNNLTKIKAFLSRNSNLAQIASKTSLNKLSELYDMTITEKHLSDCLESILGALYIDTNYNKDAIKPIILNLLEIDTIDIPNLLEENVHIDKKSQLNEWNLKTYNGEVKVNYPFENKGPPHKPKFYVGLELISKDGSVLFEEKKIGPFDRLKDGEIAIAEKFLNKIA